MNFKTDVIDKSFDIPVVVDFWAPWCGPCQMLGPVIEQLASEQAGRWELVKLNTEEEQAVAAEYGIRSIPNVKLFVDGKAIAEFSGAQARTTIMQWLDEHLPDQRKNELQAIQQDLANDSASALPELEAFVLANPDLEEARITLAQALVFQDTARAVSLVENIKMESKLHDAAEDIRTLATFFATEREENPAADKIAAAQMAASAGDKEAMITYLIEAVQLDKTYANDLPRRTAIALFRQWGTQHPLTKEYRWRFDMALY